MLVISPCVCVCVFLNTFTLLQQCRDNCFVLYRVEWASGVHHPPSHSQLLNTTHRNTQLEPGENTHTHTNLPTFLKMKNYITLFKQLDLPHKCVDSCVVTKARPPPLTRVDGGCYWLSTSSTHLCSSSWCHLHCTTQTAAKVRHIPTLARGSETTRSQTHLTG